jgi:hypothetical protein
MNEALQHPGTRVPGFKKKSKFVLLNFRKSFFPLIPTHMFKGILFWAMGTNKFVAVYMNKKLIFLPKFVFFL